MNLRHILLTLSGLMLAMMMPASAAESGLSKPWQLGFQEAATPMMARITEFHNTVLIIITLITIFVLALLVLIVIRFRASANPTPSTTTHNTLLEVIWTGVPIAILVFIAFFSFPLLYYNDTIPEADITIKATGYQWYWGYQYPDEFDEEELFANMIPDEDLAEGQPRLLATTEDIVVPVGKTVRLLVTAADVIHAWTIPAFGTKIDAVPGRINQTWFKADREGMFYGQCSELCGIKHAFMPISVRVVSEPQYNAWLANKRVELGVAPRPGDENVQLAREISN